jgi:hypothetical protein
MFRSVGFGLQLTAAAVGAVGDYLMGKLTANWTWALFTWLGVTIVASAILAVAINEAQAQSAAARINANLSRWFSVKLQQSQQRAAWPGFRDAFWIALFALFEYWVLTLTIIVLRYAQHKGSTANWLGHGSPFNQSVIEMAVRYQLSSTMVWFVFVVLLIAFILKPPAVLPVGILAVCAVNSLSIPLDPLRVMSGDPPSQLSAPLYTADGWILQLQEKALVGVCIAATIAAALILGGMIHARVSR